jgi:hypothetical protein
MILGKGIEGCRGASTITEVEFAAQRLHQMQPATMHTIVAYYIQPHRIGIKAAPAIRYDNLQPARLVGEKCQLDFNALVAQLRDCLLAQLIVFRKYTISILYSGIQTQHTML